MSEPVKIGPGSVLAGKYKVERILGKGGMGMVVAALHLQLDKLVALKFLLPEVAENPELVQRFSREAQAASKIQSEHVAKVLDVGALDGGVPFMVMEYLEGSDLSQIIKERGPLNGQDAIEYLLQACEALAEAHVAGIVHRDLKPANLFLTKLADGSPSIKILDFGISKLTPAGDQQGMTQTAAMMGSPNYMAPEQLRSARNVDARTDIWALGIVLYELLTGEVAFKADTVPELYVSILQAPPALLRSRRPDAPPALEQVILRCLEKDPARRFANVAELAAALGEFAPGRAKPSVDRIARVIGVRPPAAKTGTQQMPAQSGRPSSPVAPAHPAHGYAPQGGQPAGQPGAYGPTHYGYQHQQPHQQPRQATPYPLYAPPQATAVAPREEGMSAAQIVLIVLVTLVVLGGGGCMACYCIGVSASQKGEILPPHPPDKRVAAGHAG